MVRAEEALEEALGTGVRVRSDRSGIRAELHFDDLDDLLSFARSRHVASEMLAEKPSLRRQPFQPPTPVGPLIAEAIMQPRRLPLPELDLLRHHQEAAPEWRPGYLGAGESVLGFARAFVEARTIGQRLALR